MPQTPLIISGKVYTHNTTTAIESVIVHVKNLTTQERHDGNDSGFSDLITNVNGSFSCNLANFTKTYTPGDVMQLTINVNGLTDIILYTLGGNVNNLVLTPLSKDVYDYEQSIDEIGDRVLIYGESRTLDGDYESIDTETSTFSLVGNDAYASIQLDEDEESLEEEGVFPHGIATGFFKVRYDIQKDHKIRVPYNSDNIWVVQDKPIVQYFKNIPHHVEARLARVKSALPVAEGGVSVPATTISQITVNYSGSDLTGNDGETSRVLTITTTSIVSKEKIYLDGMRLVVDTDYTVVYNSESMVITFTVNVFDSQKITVDYEI